MPQAPSPSYSPFKLRALEATSEEYGVELTPNSKVSCHVLKLVNRSPDEQNQGAPHQCRAGRPAKKHSKNLSEREDMMAAKVQDLGKRTAEEITERTQDAMSNYFSWLQNAMSASPWANMELNRKLMSYATESVSAYVEHVQRLSQAGNVEDAVKIQTEFVQAQMELFNQRAKELREIYTQMATTRSFGMSS